ARKGKTSSLVGFVPKQARSPSTSYNTTRVYDPATDTWAVGPNLNTARSFTAAATVGNSIIVVGGYTGTADTNTVEKAISCCGPTWLAGASMPNFDVRSAGVYFPSNDKFYAMGGRSADTAGSDFTHPFEYTQATNSWATKAATYPDNQVNNMAC